MHFFKGREKDIFLNLGAKRFMPLLLQNYFCHGKKNLPLYISIHLAVRALMCHQVLSSAKYSSHSALKFTFHEDATHSPTAVLWRAVIHKVVQNLEEIRNCIWLVPTLVIL